MASWLNRQRKQTLLDLSREAGLVQDGNQLKEDIVDSLDAYLRQNATQLAHNSAFEQYYGSRRTPYKARSSSATVDMTADDAEVKSVVKGRGRRATKVKQELDDDHEHMPLAGSSNQPNHVSPVPTSTTTKRTPGRPRRQTQQLPPSPADVADLAEYESSQIFAGINDAISVSGIPRAIDSLREICSSVTGIQTAIQLVEAYALQTAVLPKIYITEITAVRGFGAPAIPIYFSDLFQLLTANFWLPTLLYATTSIFIPATLAYFCNLTVKDVKRHGARVSIARYPIDPLTFNVVKALLTWVVYGQDFMSGAVGADNVLTVRNAMFGGYQGVIIGCGVCILASLYEAAQRKV
ncbi:hypothetical protein BAUCODRAFT_34099 [Baudoinia panamericana UAMH 10762]|uniref:Uncharacterized protein n=1 Tax=Baudoinia panamericana (strain UAMH 10762) TaxID=717646 RepID=M2NC18_BAUPA|nr:uncharacterized protein BAUCODRAFT_34099 [Baudoinia panamericana UAMH 10762]EMC96714.1 hypothetical protein BAUCODRAFT_34099 [Baudoinia panamericana UAMH 10762]